MASPSNNDILRNVHSSDVGHRLTESSPSPSQSQIRVREKLTESPVSGL